MSFKAELSVEGNTYPLSCLALLINQDVDSVGRPSSGARGGRIYLEMDVVNDNMITEWIVNPGKTMNGSITYYRTDEESRLKEVQFENAYCIELLERFDGTPAGNYMVTCLTLSAEKIMMGSVELSNNWLN